jgi:tRNA wybutosine-synthesizing protein 3
MSWETYRASRLAAYKKALAEGKVDSRIVSLLDNINRNPDLVTLSSCSGRIDLLIFEIEKGKDSAKHYAKWHSPVEREDFEMRLTSYAGKPPLWFKVEPFILHVAARDVKAAIGFMRTVRGNGVKRGGIQGIAKDRVPIEVQGTGYMAFPTEPMEGEWNMVLDIANSMLKRNLEQVKRLEKIEW